MNTTKWHVRAPRGGRAVCLVIWLALAGACGDDGGYSEPTDLSELTLPVIVTQAGITYQLSGTFQIRAAPDPLAPVVRTLRVDPRDGGAVVRTVLQTGTYYVSLEPGWVLSPIGRPYIPSEAFRLDSPNPQEVTIGINTGANLDFRFVLSETPYRGEGTLSIGIDVIPPVVCGDGYVTGDEVCDQGLRNGQPDACDGSCAFVCRGPCPLRVDPSGAQDGTGATFADAMRDVQTAIDQQATFGGGEVWVRGGEHPSLHSSDGRLLRLRDGVVLRGGFVGHERTANERAVDAPYTELVDQRPPYGNDNYDENLNLISLTGVRKVEIERFRLAGPGVLVGVRNSSEVRFSDVTFAAYYGLVIDHAEVRIERARFEPEWGPVGARAAQLAIVDSSFVNSQSGNPFQPGSLTASEGSMLLLSRVRSDGPATVSQGSKALFIDTTFRSSWDRGSYLEAYDTIIVGSQFVNDGLWSITSLAPLRGRSLFVFNTSFVGLRVMLRESGFSYAAIHADDLEVAASSFFGNRCRRSTHDFCNIDVGGKNAEVHNSLFVHDTEKQYPDDPPRRSLAPGVGDRANCRSSDSSLFDITPVGSGQVLSRSYPCDDGGDEALLEAARMRLFARAAPFLGAPFHADLTRYQSPDWWRDETVRTNTCHDTEGPDPGRHFMRACMP